ncbi:hypothetical protein G7054_g11292 [Neopestalotiopsis clavispora]|nr:hypothetical protein G7054_g11292 [Neopestalotiopsis clavispora]
MFATARISILGMLLPYLVPARGYPITVTNDGITNDIRQSMSTVHDGLTSSSTDKAEADSVWSFTLWSGMECTGVQVEEYGGANTSCALAAPPSYLGLSNNFIDPDKYVVFFHSVDCSGTPLFTLSNNTDVAGCWAPNVGEAIWSFQVKNSYDM